MKRNGIRLFRSTLRHDFSCQYGIPSSAYLRLAAAKGEGSLWAQTAESRSSRSRVALRLEVQG